MMAQRRAAVQSRERPRARAEKDKQRKQERRQASMAAVHELQQSQPNAIASESEWQQRLLLLNERADAGMVGGLHAQG